MGTRSSMILGRAWKAAAHGAAWGVLVALAGCGGGGSSGGSGGGGGGTASYTLGGTVTGLGSNTGLVLANGSTTLSVPAGAGTFTFPGTLTAGTAYSVTVQSSPAGLNCTVSGGSGTMSANVSSVMVACATQSYTLAGTVAIGGPTGVALSDQGLVLTNSSNGDKYTFASNATVFTMAKSVSYGSAYAITVTTQPTHLSCSVTNGAGTMPAGNVTAIVVTCTDQAYSLGGTITGLGSATGLVLTNEGADATAVAANSTSFTMHTAVPYGAAYSVAVKVTPTDVGCTVTNGSGTMPGANVTNVQLACAAGTESVLHAFGGTGDGSTPQGGLVQAKDGNLYGMTNGGGARGAGTVFKITPTGTETVLWSFGGSGDGANPVGSLIQASDGNLYGTTTSGGSAGQGTVFKITTAGVETVLYSFAGGTSDGSAPYGALLQASDGNLYGTTNTGGAHGDGIVYRVTTAGVETVLWSFGGTNDGLFPYGALIQATDGNLYGTTELGGTGNLGTVYRITLSPSVTETVLHSFAGGTGDGSSPYDGLVQASDGNLYGTTALGGANGSGTVFKMTLTGTPFALLHSFGTGTDGVNPYGRLMQAADGNLYGMANTGGTANQGVVFRISTAGTEAIVYSFAAGSDGYGPKEEALIQASNGGLYGLTPHGGANSAGVVFEIN